MFMVRQGHSDLIILAKVPDIDHEPDRFPPSIGVLSGWRNLIEYRLIALNSRSSNLSTEGMHVIFGPSQTGCVLVFATKLWEFTFTDV